MVRLFTYAASFSLFLLVACNSTNSKTANEVSQTATSDTLSYTMETYRVESKLEKKPGDTIKEKTYFEASYPQFEDSLLNAYVQSILVYDYNPDIHFSTLKEAGEGFIKAYDDYQKLDYSSPWPWYNNRNIRVLENKPAYISVGLDYDDFMGGAHGNHGTVYGNYDRNLKKEISLNDLIQEGKMDSLTLIAKEIFIKQEGIENQEDAFKAYFFKDDTFALNDNFLLKDSTIQFLYNVYEIKPYASGITKLTIPYNNIKSLLTPKAKEILTIN